MSEEKNTFTEMPEEFCGTWSVTSYKTTDGHSGIGADRDQWVIQPDAITCGRSDSLYINRIEAKIEADQDVHWVTFKNNRLQFAFLRSKADPGVTLAIEYLDGEEKLRCLLSKEK